MIRVRHWQNTINQMPMQPDAWDDHGHTLESLANPGAVACWYDGRAIPPEEFASVTPRDCADVTFVYTHADGGLFNAGFGLFGANLINIAFGGEFRPSLIGTPPGFRLAYKSLLQPLGRLAMGAVVPSLGGDLSLGGGSGGSAAYGSERPTSATQNGTIVPICYGIVQTGGAILMGHARAESGGGSLSYRMIVALSHGPITSIGTGAEEIDADVDDLTGASIPDGILFGEVEANTLQNVTLHARLGGANQTIPPGFERPYVGYEYAIRLNRDIIAKHECKREVDELEVLLNFPRGLSSMSSKDGAIASFSITVQFRVYTLAGSLVRTENVTINGRKRENMYYSHNIAGLDLDRYRLEVERTVVGGSGNLNPDENEARRVYDCEVAQVYESDPYGPAYRGVAHLCINAQASEQLQGFPVVRSIVTGRPVYDPREATQAVTGATNATPIVLTAVGHGINSGAVIRVFDVGGNTAANNEWEVGAVMTDTLELIGSRGSGDYTSGGEISVCIFSRNNALVSADLMFNEEYGLGRKIPFETISTASLSDAADWCEEDVPEVTGSATEEPRFLCDLVVDTRRGGWEMIVELARNARLIPVRYGNQIEWIIEEARGSNQDLEMSKGNTLGVGPTVTYSALTTRPNQIAVNYQDRDTWEQKRVVARLDDPAFDAGLEAAEVSRLGCTRRTEALRAAFFELRRATMIGSFATIDTGLDALAIRPGDIVTTSRRATRVWSGRVVSGTSTTRVLDQSITFETGRAYEYTERIDDGSLARTEFTTPGATTISELTTSTVPSFPAGTPTGRIFAVREFGRVKEQFMVTSITNLDRVKKRIQGELYPGTLAYNDDTGPDDTGVITPTPTPQPADVTDAAVDAERVSDRGRSEFDLSWTGATGAVTYRIYARNVTQDTAFALLTTVTGEAATVRLSAAFGELVEFGIVAVSRRGAANTPDSLASSARVSHTILRDDDNSIIAEIPDDPENVAVGSFTGTDATLSWDAVANADGYELYLNIWQHGKVFADITNPATTSYAIKGNDRILGIGVRAYIELTNADGNAVRYYSVGDTRAATSRVVPSGYSATPDIFQNEFVSVGLRNGSMIQFFSGTSNRAMLQIDPGAPLIYRLPVEDALTSAQRFISLDVRPFPWLRRPADDTSWAHPQYGFEGAVNRRYFDWRVFLLYGDAGTAGDETSEGSITNATRLDVTDLLQTDIVVTGRYFTVEFVGNLREDIPLAEGEVLICLERVALAANPLS
jgi:hypothetical protein